MVSFYFILFYVNRLLTVLSIPRLVVRYQGNINNMTRVAQSEREQRYFHVCHLTRCVTRLLEMSLLFSLAAAGCETWSVSDGVFLIVMQDRTHRQL